MAPVIRALNAMEAATSTRSTSPPSVTTGTSRSAPARSSTVSASADLALDRGLSTLSGGQVVSLGLAAQLLKRPDVLLLDEPTNNLDVDARQQALRRAGDYTGCLLLVSHDRVLLDRMERIAELDRGELRLYGGNFSAVRGGRAGDAAGRREERSQRRAGAEAREARAAAGPRARRAPVEQRGKNLTNAGLPRSSPAT